MENKFFDIEDDFDEEVEPEPIKKTKKSKSKAPKIKTMGLFDHLNAITKREYDSAYFDNLSDGEKKTFDIYMINRFLSMNSEWLSTVNYFQQYSQVISNVDAYRFYANIIPKSKLFLKYVKGEKEAKYNKELISIMSEFYETSRREAISSLDVLYTVSGGMDEVKRLCAMYGNDEKDIKKLIKV